LDLSTLKSQNNIEESEEQVPTALSWLGENTKSSIDPV